MSIDDALLVGRVAACLLCGIVAPTEDVRAQVAYRDVPATSDHDSDAISRDWQSNHEAPEFGEPGIVAMPPPAFIMNQGQWDAATRFLAQVGDVVVRAEADAIAVQKVHRASDDNESCAAMIRFAFEGPAGQSLRAAAIRGEGQAPARYSYFAGNASSRWRKDVPAFMSVVYGGIAPGTELRLGFREGLPSYDLIFEPGVLVDQFVLRCEGINGLDLDKSGALVLQTPLGPLIQQAPVAWQVASEGDRHPVPVRFALRGPASFGFVCDGSLDPNRSTVIDPGIDWATYLGGAGGDEVRGVRRRADGNIMTFTLSDSPDFPTTPGAYDPDPAGDRVCISCFEPSGSTLLFSAQFGGFGHTEPLAWSVDAQGRIAFGGSTQALDLPTTAGAYSSDYGGGLSDAYVAMLSDDGSQLLYSTYLPGSCNETVNGVAFDPSGQIIAAGGTCSPDFPPGTPGAYDPSFAGTNFGDGFIAWLDPAASGSAQITRLTYLGSSDGESIDGLDMLPGGELLVWGETFSPDFPITANVWKPVFTSLNSEQFASIFSPDVSTLVASSFIFGEFLAAGPDGAITTSGTANNTGLPVTPGAFDPTWNGSSDAYAIRMDAALSQVVWCTYLGGSEADGSRALAVGADGSVLLTGQTASSDFPVTPFAPDSKSSLGVADPFVARLSADGSQLAYSTYLGSSSNVAATGAAIAFDGPDYALAGGFTTLADFPTTPGAFDPTYNGGGDGYVARLPLTPPWTTLGGGLAGLLGVPKLTATGWPEEGQVVKLTLARAKPSSATTLVLGVGILGEPFKGGTLVPTPDALVVGLVTDANGSLALSGAWPPGVPDGFTVCFQHWIVDSAGPQGLSASNGLLVSVP